MTSWVHFWGMVHFGALYTFGNDEWPNSVPAEEHGGRERALLPPPAARPRGGGAARDRGPGHDGLIRTPGTVLDAKP
eukprot:2441706-Rhodomonas_salina.1